MVPQARRVSRGAQGTAGATGLQGSIGVTGAVGPVGPQGSGGRTGAAGTNGAPGTNGINGATGTNGAAGVAGPAGPAGGLAEYAYVYNLSAAVVAIEAAINFSSNGVITGGITHAPTGAGIVLAKAGDYKITFSVSGVEPNQMALFVNGAVVAGGSVYGSGAGTQQTTGQMIITAAAGDVLTVVNHSSAAAVTLQTLAGGTQTNANASVIVEKLS